MISRSHVTILVLALTALGVRPAAAQTPQRPFRGLFGGAQAMNTRGEMVDLSMSAFVGWDQPQTQIEPLDSTTDNRTLVSGPYSGGSGSQEITSAEVICRPSPAEEECGNGHASGGWL